MKQQVFTGENSLIKIQDLLLERSINSVFIVIGRHFQQDARFTAIKNLFVTVKQHVFVKQGVNVTSAEVEQAYTVYKSENVQLLLAIGGGSIMDLAKGLLYRDCQDQRKEKPFFIAVPTTAGSGSEATCIAVVYDENKRKQSLENNKLLPDIAILDPMLSITLSPAQTAISGIDAFAQGIESFWSIHATSHSKSFAREAIMILKEYLPLAVNEPTIQIRERMLWASHLAGKAINITRTTGPHALSYFLSAHYNVPHGQAVALFLSLFFDYNSNVNEKNCNHPDGTKAVLTSSRELISVLQVTDQYKAVVFIRDFIKSLGLEISLKGLGIEKSPTIENLVDEVNQQRFKNNPVLFDREKLIRLCHEHL